MAASPKSNADRVVAGPDDGFIDQYSYLTHQLRQAADRGDRSTYDHLKRRLLEIGPAPFHDLPNDRPRNIAGITATLRAADQRHKSLIELCEWFSAQETLDVFKHDPHMKQLYTQIVTVGLQSLLGEVK